MIYFPRDDIAMAFLDESDHRTHLPAQGRCQLLFDRHQEPTLENAAWSYEAPVEVARIKGHTSRPP